MAFVTFNQLAHASQKITEGQVKIAKSLTHEKSLFLSHSQHDKSAIVRGAVSILAEHGAKVYVDVMDSQIGVMSTNDRCSHVRSVIHQCQRLVVLFSDNTKTSRWIPWELGLSDGLHDLEHVATLPVTHTGSEETWGTQEYFGLYPQIR